MVSYTKKANKRYLNALQTVREIKYQTYSDHVHLLKNKITEYKSNDVKQYPVFIKLHLKDSGGRKTVLSDSLSCLQEEKCRILLSSQDCSCAHDK